MHLLELAGEDDPFAAREAAAACSSVEVIAPGLATASELSDRFPGLAYTRAASRLVGTCDPTIQAASTLLEASVPDCEALSDASTMPADHSTIAVRARDVRSLTGVSTREAERALGDVLTDAGYAVDLDDPDAELRALFSEGHAPRSDTDGANSVERSSADRREADGESRAVCALGWLEAETVRHFGERRPTDKPFFQPGSMDPLLARAVANVAGARPDALLVDPMCGTGGILVEAGLVGADVVGVDAQGKMVRGARENFRHYLHESRPPAHVASPGRFAVARGDATRLPLGDDVADAVVVDAPYGRQSKIANRSLDALVAGALDEARRVAPRAVVVGDRSWADEATDAGWTVESSFRRRVHRSLDRHVLVLAADA